MTRPRLNALVKLEYNPRKPSVWDYDENGAPLFFSASTEKHLIKSAIAREIEGYNTYSLKAYTPINTKAPYTYKKHKSYSTAEPTWYKYHNRHKKLRGKKRHYAIRANKVRYTEEWEKENKQ